MGIIFDIQHSSFVDGPGIRTSVFFKGCNLNCAWCHNPESRSMKPQKMFYENNCKHCGLCKAVCQSPKGCVLCGKCAEICPNGAISITGRQMSVNEVMEEIMRDKLFYGQDGGVTFSGGECMLQIDFLLELLKKCRQNGINTAVDTAGNVDTKLFDAVLPYTDVFLYDIKCITEQTHIKYTGVSNKLILKNYAHLIKNGARVIVRIPVIGGVNDTKKEMLLIKKFFDEVGYPQKTELLPYHKMGDSKYKALQLNKPEFTVPPKEKIEEFKKIFI